jgi:hypothetical protein
MHPSRVKIFTSTLNAISFLETDVNKWLKNNPKYKIVSIRLDGHNVLVHYEDTTTVLGNGKRTN